MARVYTTLTGIRIEYDDPTGARAKFFARFEALFANPRTKADTLTVLAYSPENPILSWDFFPHRGPIKEETLRDPLYQVMQDMIARKRVAEDGTDLAKLEASYSVPLTTAARMRDTGEQTFRSAIATLRMPAWMKDNKYYLKPETVEAFKLDARGRKRKGATDGGSDAPAGEAVVSDTASSGELHVCVGHMKGLKFQLKSRADLTGVVRQRGHIHEGTLADWERVGFFAGDATSGTYDGAFYVLERGKKQNRIEVGPFFVRGRFSIVSTDRATGAHERFRKFVPA